MRGRIIGPIVWAAGCVPVSPSEPAQIERSVAPSATEPAREPAPEPAAEVELVLQPAPRVGVVFAHGGGPLRASAIREFHALCGPGHRLVVVPSAVEAADRPEYRARLVRIWERHGFDPVTIVHPHDRREAEQPETAAPLVQADCAWIGGGAQARLEALVLGTPLETALLDLVHRGGALGGYSAGTAFLSRVMIRRGNPTPEEGQGLGAVAGVVLDQHFVAAGREPRLRTLLAAHPELLGYGIDEGTALVIIGDTVRVIGESIVRVCGHDTGCATLSSGTTRALLAPP